MKNVFAHLAVPVPKDATYMAREVQSELVYVKDRISFETIAMLHAYMDTLAITTCYHKDNDPGSTVEGASRTVPQLSPDVALRYAIASAHKLARVKEAAAKGEWALRKLKRKTATLAV